MENMKQPNLNVRLTPSVFFYPSIFLLSAALGLGVGWKVHETFRQPLVRTIGNADAYSVDVEAVMSHYEKAKASGGHYEKELEPYEFVCVAYERFSQLEHSASRGVGSSLSTGVKQAIQSATYRDGDLYFEESNSFSDFVKLFDRMYQEGEQVTKYWGKSPTYAGLKPQVVSTEEYKAQMGRLVSQGLAYLVSPGTMSQVDLSGDGLSKVEKDAEGNYIVDFEADPASSTLNYIHQMKTISGLSDYPSFSFCHLKWKMDSELNLQWFQTHESYVANMGITATCEGRLTTVYTEIGPEDPNMPLPDGELPHYPGGKSAYPATPDELIRAYGYTL